MPYDIPPRDPRIHVFSVSDGQMTLTHQTYLSRLTEPEAPSAVPLVEAVGADIDATYAEVFAVGDLAPMSLRDYLAQAHDVPADTLAADAAKLDALSGDVVVLAPRAVEGIAALSPRPELTPIGAYAPAGADMTPKPLPKAGYQPRPATPAVATGSPTSNRTIVLVVAAALVLAVVLVMLF
jgi:hypothetical protein